VKVRQVKMKGKKNRHHPVSFHTKRYREVSKRLSFLLECYIASREKKKKFFFLREYESVAYFDSPLHRRELTNYVTFLNNIANRNIEDIVSHYLAEFEKLSLNTGVINSLKIFKDLHGIACRYVVGHSFGALPYIKSDQDGFPKILEPFRSLLEGTIEERQVALGITIIPKVIDFHPSRYDLGTIGKQPLNETSAFTEDPLKVGTYFEEAFRKVKSDLPDDFNIKRLVWSYKTTLKRMFPVRLQPNRLKIISKLSGLHFSGRNGPNGPCLGTVVCDYDALARDP